MKTVAEAPGRLLATAAEILMAEGMNDTAGILRVSSAKIEETGYGPVMRVLQSALLSRLLILQLKLTLSDMLQRKYPSPDIS